MAPVDEPEDAEADYRRLAPILTGRRSWPGQMSVPLRWPDIGNREAQAAIRNPPLVLRRGREGARCVGSAHKIARFGILADLNESKPYPARCESDVDLFL